MVDPLELIKGFVRDKVKSNLLQENVAFIDKVVGGISKDNPHFNPESLVMKLMVEVHKHIDMVANNEMAYQEKIYNIVIEEIKSQFEFEVNEVNIEA